MRVKPDAANGAFFSLTSDAYFLNLADAPHGHRTAAGPQQRGQVWNVES